jgi:hypothetical protein
MDLKSVSTTGSLFTQPWWLDAIAPNCWDQVVLERDGVPLARFPYMIKRRFGLTLLTMPPLTQHLGPFYSIDSQKTATYLSRETRLLNELIDGLPSFDYFNQRFHHSQTNWLPFYWRGFRQTTHYTYVLQDLTDPDRLWAGFRDNIRREIRKAQKQVTIRSDLSLDEFWILMEKTFKRQNLKPPYPREAVERLDLACDQRGQKKIFCAEDSAGQIHAAIYIVWDDQSAYYLMGGGDETYRRSGATSLLMWEAIQFAATVTRKFDFEGSMLQPVERFFRSFGAVQMPYFRISKVQSPILKGLDALGRIPT